jgi:hypothetical protein
LGGRGFSINFLAWRMAKQDFRDHGGLPGRTGSRCCPVDCAS